MVGARIARVELRRPDLRAPFPRGFAQRMKGATTLALTRRAKYLVAALSSGDSLLMHLGMSGSFRIPQRSDAGARTITSSSTSARGPTSSSTIRGGSGSWISCAPTRVDRHPSLRGLGPEPLSPAFDAGGARPGVRGQAHVAEGRRCSINRWWPGWGTSTPWRRCTSPASRRCGERPPSRRPAVHRARRPSVSRPPSSRCSPKPSSVRPRRRYRSGSFPRLRPRGRALPPPALPRCHPPPHAGGTVDVLLPCLPEVSRGGPALAGPTMSRLTGGPHDLQRHRVITVSRYSAGTTRPPPPPRSARRSTPADRLRAPPARRRRAPANALCTGP